MKTFFDIGVGGVNNEAFTKTYEDFQIIGLEPCNSKYGRIKNIFPGVLLNMVTSDVDGVIYGWERHDAFQLLEPDINPIRPGYYHQVQKTSITLDTLWDTYAKDSDEIHVWADIEGSELMMLHGATRLLSSGKLKWILLEITKTTPNIKDWPKPKQIYTLMNKYGFVPNVAMEELPDNHYKNVIFTPKRSVS